MPHFDLKLVNSSLKEDSALAVCQGSIDTDGFHLSLKFHTPSSIAAFRSNMREWILGDNVGPNMSFLINAIRQSIGEPDLSHFNDWEETNVWRILYTALSEIIKNAGEAVIKHPDRRCELIEIDFDLREQFDSLDQTTKYSLTITDNGTGFIGPMFEKIKITGTMNAAEVFHQEFESSKVSDTVGGAGKGMAQAIENLLAEDPKATVTISNLETGGAKIVFTSALKKHHFDYTPADFHKNLADPLRVVTDISPLPLTPLSAASSSSGSSSSSKKRLVRNNTPGSLVFTPPSSTKSPVTTAFSNTLPANQRRDTIKSNDEVATVQTAANSQPSP